MEMLIEREVEGRDDMLALLVEVDVQDDAVQQTAEVLAEVTGDYDYSRPFSFLYRLARTESDLETVELTDREVEEAQEEWLERVEGTRAQWRIDARGLNL